MADQNIKLKIAGREYCLKASSPEIEETYRKAAQAVNNRISAYRNTFAGKEDIDILSLVALSGCTNEIKLSKMIEDVKKEAEQLKNDLGGYIENIDKNSR